MPTFAVRCKSVDAEPGRGESGVVYFRASSRAVLDGALRQRLLVAERVDEVPDDAWPPGAGLVFVREPEPVVPPTPAQRRLRLMAYGVGAAVVLLLMMMFVMRAKEHLLQRDIIPPGAVLERSQTPPAPVGGGAR